MLKFALRHMAVRRTKLIMICLSIIITACVALLAYNISTQISEGIIQTAANFDIIIGPSGSSTQLAMNTMFFTDKPLGTIPYSLVDEIQSSASWAPRPRCWTENPCPPARCSALLAKPSWATTLPGNTTSAWVPP